MIALGKEPYLSFVPRGMKFAVTSDNQVAMGFHYELAYGRGLRLSFALSPTEARKIAFKLLKNADEAQGRANRVIQGGLT